MDRIKNKRGAILICALLAGSTLAAYWPVFHNGFVRFDDIRYITENPHVLPGLTWQNIKWSLGAGYAGNWHPLTWMSHMLDVQLFGLRASWHHGVNLFFHTANSLLLFLLLRRMTGALWRSALVAGLFALHPLHVESVAWAAERKDVLSTFFFMLTLLAYARYAAGKAEREWRIEDRGRKVEKKKASRVPASTLHAPSSLLHPPCSTRLRPGLWYALSLALFALGLMSKPMLVTLPFVLLLLDYWPLGRLRPSGVQGSRFEVRRSMFVPVLLEKLPFLALSAASCVVTFIVQDKGHAVSTVEGFPLEPRLATALVAYVKYLGKMLWPTRLAVFYPHPGIRGPQFMYPDWVVLLAVLLLALLTLGAVLRLRSEPWFAVGWFWYLGTLVPVIGILQVGGQEMADRYTYIPLIGIFVALAWAIPCLESRAPELKPQGPTPQSRTPASESAQPASSKSKPLPQPVAPPAAAPSSGRLYQSVLAALGLAVLAACAAVTHHQVQYWHDNYTLFKHALAVTKDNAPALYNVAIALEQQGKMDQAEAKFRAAAEADPSFSDAYFSIGTILASRGKIDEAIAEYQTALRLQPWNALAHNGLGATYWRQGKTKEAIAEYTQALQFEPFLREAHFNLGVALLAEGDLPGAESHLREAARLKPGDPETLRRLATVLVRQGKLAEAEGPLRQLVSLFPTNSVSYYDLGDVLRLQGKIAESATEFAQAVHLRPDFPAALTGLGHALAAQGKMAEAEARFRQVAGLCPTNAQAQVTLGEALMVTGNTNEARACFERACRLAPELVQQNLEQGKALVLKGELRAAQGHFLTALSLEPDNPEAHEQVGLLLRSQGQLTQALPQLEAALHLGWTNAASERADWCYNLGLAFAMQGNLGLAATNFQQALALNPKSLPALNDLAWLRATAAQPQYRDGAEAVRLAEQACRLSGGQEARFWGTLDAAYAEAGHFEQAIATAEKAHSLAVAAGDQALASAAEQRLELYRKHQPVRQ